MTETMTQFRDVDVGAQFRICTTRGVMSGMKAKPAISPDYKVKFNSLINVPNEIGAPIPTPHWIDPDFWVFI